MNKKQAQLELSTYIDGLVSDEEVEMLGLCLSISKLSDGVGAEATAEEIEALRNWATKARLDMKLMELALKRQLDIVGIKDGEPIFRCRPTH